MDENYLINSDSDSYNTEDGELDPSIDNDVSQMDEDDTTLLTDEEIESLEEEQKLDKDGSSTEEKYDNYDLKLIKHYDQVLKSTSLSDAVQVVLASNPTNTNSMVIMNMTKALLHLQGKNRLQITYSPDLLTSRYIEENLEDNDSSDINERIEADVKDLIWRFIKFLAERDLSKDSISSRRTKQRQLPALIIYLFHIKMYGLLLGCPYLPEVYKKQIDNALNKINESKHQLVEELAKMYEDAGRTEVAKKVRDMDVNFFDIEPAQLKQSVYTRSLDITDADVIIYKSVRTKFVNSAKSVTQEYAADMIEVVVDADAGIYEKLKDKVRTEAIKDVKRLLKEFAENSIVSKDNATVKSILFS